MSEKQETPRTDEFCASPRGLGTGYYQALDFARTLERELTQERQRRERAEKALDDATAPTSEDGKKLTTDQRIKWLDKELRYYSAQHKFEHDWNSQVQMHAIGRKDCGASEIIHYIDDLRSNLSASNQALAEAREAMRWIPCEERMPTVEDRNSPQGWVWWRFGDQQIVAGVWNPTNPNFRPTHWLHIPPLQPPTQE